ncbi:Rho GTPase activator [Pleurostoma richardsiae]|uniref:Rho GTPase activator n=1 Tax=Pleurostoma richardsiae TaxID=41990 RepID=A0AA38RQP1_9PEZI|nr:Rho GTPase activator [Pleurostoma richardsiae]
MTEYNASTDFLPNPRERTGSMSLGGTPTENGAPTNGAAAPLSAGAGSPTTATMQPADVSKDVQDVLTSEIGIVTMLNRLKQSIASAREFAAFLSKRAKLEEEQANGIKKLAKITTESMHRSEHLGGSFLQAYDNMMAVHERMAENGLQFAASLHQMHEDLHELAAIADKNRKGWKQNGLAAEQRVADIEAQMRKSQAKYHSLAEEYDRVRTGDTGGQKGGKMFGFKGPKSAAQHEEDLLRKVQAADQDYQTKVQILQTEKGELVDRTRPEAIKALQDIIKECDSGLLLQMQKFASFNEKLLLSNGLSISPLKNAKGPLARPADAQSLRDIVLAVDSDKDLNDYIRSNHSKVPPQTGEPKYEQHPVLSRSSGAPIQIQQPQVPAVQPMGQPMGQPGAPPPQMRPQSSLPSSPAGQPQFAHRQQPSVNQGFAGSPGMGPMMSGGQRPSSRGQPPQHERNFSHSSMTSQQGIAPGQQQYPPQGPNVPNSRFNSSGNAGSLSSQQGPPQLGALPFQTSSGSPAPGQDRSSQGVTSPVQQQPPNGASGPLSLSQGSQAPAPQMPPARPVFGVSLQRLYERDGLAVPMVVYQCIQAVDLFGLNVEGIYRLSGSVPHVNRLKAMFDTDSSSPALDFRNPENFFHDVNSVAGLLKQFFRDLPDPLLTREHYSAFIDAAKNDDDIVRRDSLHAIINSLPDPNYATLRALTLHLYRVMDSSHLTRMNSQNLAIVFGPTLMGTSAQGHIADAGWQVRVVDTILQNTYQIFDDD